MSKPYWIEAIETERETGIGSLDVQAFLTEVKRHAAKVRCELRKPSAGEVREGGFTVEVSFGHLG